MEKLKIVPLVCILALTCCFGGVAYAQEEAGLPDPGITPDSPFYFADKWARQLTLMFTFKEEAKVRKAFQYAEERMAELDVMLAKNRVREATEANNEYQNCLAIATKSMERTQVKGTGTSDMVALAASKHLEILNDRIADAPQNAQVVLTQTRERARICQEAALRSMVQGDPEKAAGINLRLMERQLRRIRVRVEEQQATELQEELQEYKRLGNLGEEISQIATELGKGTTVDQLVGQATAYQLALLAEVHQRVQEQSRQAVEDATRVCVAKHERLVASLKENNMLGQLPEEPPIPEEIPKNLRQRISSGESHRK